MTPKFSPDMNQLLCFCKEEAERLHNDSVSPVHLLLAILRMKGNKALDVLVQLSPDVIELKHQLEEAARKSSVLIPPASADMNLDVAASRIMRLCVLESKLMASDIVDVIHILLAIMKNPTNEAAAILLQQNISYQEVAEKVSATSQAPQASSTNDDVDDEEEEEEDGELEAVGDVSPQAATRQGQQKKKLGKTPALDNFGFDLTQAAAEGLLDPVVGREQEIERVSQILCRRKKNNPILIGLPGVGKSAIVEGLAMRIVEHRISRTLWNKRVVTLDMAAVVAGTKYRGQFEERIRNIMQELKQNPDIIVFIDEIHTIIGAGNASGQMDAANMLKPALARGEFQCIGSTTTDEYRKTIEKDGALERRFQKVQVQPTNKQETMQILLNLRDRYEEHHCVRYSDEALEACVSLAERYITDRSFPDKAIDVMDEVGSRLHIQNVPVPEHITQLETEVEKLTDLKNEAVKRQNFELAADYRDQLKQAEEELAGARSAWEEQLNDQRTEVSEDDVAQVVGVMTGIPVTRISTEEGQRLRTLGERLQARVVGQDDAIRTLTRSILRSRVGLKDPNRPIGCFLFVGPTGVGKTYLTKCLATELFGSPDAIIRIDMSEYMEKHTVSRMVGAPPGYVGYEEGGQLTEKVRRKPYSIVLLDEIEKAHADVYNMLLQVMDEGRLTDGNGTTIDFKNTVVIMTSNCGTKQIKDFGHGIGFGQGEDITQNKAKNHDIVKKALEKQFPPEFLNRLDDIIHFDQLTADSIRQIVDIELTPLLARIHEMGYQLQVTDEAKDLIGKKGYDVQFGARPLKRALQSLLEDELCDAIMNGTIQQGTPLTTAVEGEKITLKTV